VRAWHAVQQPWQACPRHRTAGVHGGAAAQEAVRQALEVVLAQQESSDKKEAVQCKKGMESQGGERVVNRTCRVERWQKEPWYVQSSPHSVCMAGRLSWYRQWCTKAKSGC